MGHGDSNGCARGVGVEGIVIRDFAPRSGPAFPSLPLARLVTRMASWRTWKGSLSFVVPLGVTSQGSLGSGVNDFEDLQLALSENSLDFVLRRQVSLSPKEEAFFVILLNSLSVPCYFWREGTARTRLPNTLPAKPRTRAVENVPMTPYGCAST